MIGDLKGKEMGRYNTIDDYWNQVDKTAANGCWEWTGQKNKDGYGCFQMNKQWMHTHRWAMHFVDKNPSGYVVMHHCDNPKCVNPEHLSLGTQQDNIRDMHTKGRYVKPKSKLSDLDLLEIRQSKLSLSKIAKKFDISTCYASNIRNYKGPR